MGQRALPTNFTVVDRILHRDPVSGLMSETVLGVDQENIAKVLLRLSEKDRPGEWQLEEILGQQASVSSAVKSKAPAKSIITQVHTITQKRLRLHVLVTWSFVEYEGPLYSLYVVQEDLSTRRTALVFSDEGLGRELFKFIVQDIDDDGTVEIADIGAAGNTTYMRIRRAMAPATVVLLQQLEGYMIRANFDRWPGQEVQRAIIIEEKVDCQRPNMACVMRHEYRWSKKESKFLLERNGE